ncbi:MAG TPA: alpha/beta hydrolase [Kofleriaceae bacterium]|jgi:pimeloyl-ACP methyl ester carboxylesterase|nr:alpha/beta hydrolase [Kofleriaceae bacterium]
MTLPDLRSAFPLLASLTVAVGCAPAPRPGPATPAAPVATPVAQIDALAFGVRVTGHGPPMILIAGLASSGDVWNTTVAHEQDRFTCHVIELPGFAGRPRIPAPMLSTVRDALAGYIRDHHLDHPVIVGHSLGGFLALDLARSYPDLPGKLVIVDSLPFLPGAFDPGATVESMRVFADAMRTRTLSSTEAAFEQQERGILATMITSPAQQEVALGWVMRSDRSAVADALVEMMTTDLRPRLGAITAPTLVVETWTGWGAGRESVEQNYARQYAELRGARFVVADTAKHFVMFDDPAFLFAQMDAFLR